MPTLDLVAPAPPRKRLDYWREHRFPAIIWPQSWAKDLSHHSLSWEKLRFTEDNRMHIPQVRGIYAFVVSIESSFIPSHGYIAYIGITGDKHERNLRDRYGDYLRDRRRGSKRPKMKDMFDLWGDQLDFWFCPFPDKSKDLGALEREINTLLLPPFVENDFERAAKAEIKLLRAN